MTDLDLLQFPLSQEQRRALKDLANGRSTREECLSRLSAMRLPHDVAQSVIEALCWTAPVAIGVAGWC